jgi:hypothetical protein
MFVLRIIEETRENESVPFNQVIENFEIGSSYSVIRKNDSDEFDSIMKKEYPDVNKADISALLCVQRCDEHGNIFFIYPRTPTKQFSYFIMTENGKTFERL